MVDTISDKDIEIEQKDNRRQFLEHKKEYLILKIMKR